MFQSIFEDLKREFSTGNIITRLVLINIGVFIAINAVWVITKMINGGTASPLYYDILHFFCVSSSIMHNITHPWVFLTSIFLHEGFWHLLWNMLFLYWFGRIVADLIGDNKILPLYLLGGLVGCVVFWASAQIFPYYGNGETYALGASAGVMAIVMTSGMIAPDYNLRLLLIGDVKLKYVVGVLILVDIFGLASDVNTGGHFAHLGGVLMGWFFVQQLREGNDWSEGVNNMLFKIKDFFREKKETVHTAKERKLVVKKHYRQKPDKLSDMEVQERIDMILDKIKAKGYDSLSNEEKDFLNNASSHK